LEDLKLGEEQKVKETGRRERTGFFTLLAKKGV
jgi:hypothetical protein